MTNAVLRGKPDAGNPHVRFDEGEVASAKPRRGSLLYNGDNLTFRDNTIAYDKPSFPILPCSGKIRIEGGTRIDVPGELIDKTVSIDPNRPGGN